MSNEGRSVVAAWEIERRWGVEIGDAEAIAALVAERMAAREAEVRADFDGCVKGARIEERERAAAIAAFTVQALGLSATQAHQLACAIRDEPARKTEGSGAAGPPEITTGSDGAAPSAVLPKCADCGSTLGESEAKVFTVCDSCWDRHYKGASPTGDKIRGEARAQIAAPSPEPCGVLSDLNEPACGRPAGASGYCDKHAPSPAPAAHAYTSTACQHGKHARCRMVCKFCTVPCACPCGHPTAERAPNFDGDPPLSVERMREIRRVLDRLTLADETPEEAPPRGQRYDQLRIVTSQSGEDMVGVHVYDDTTEDHWTLLCDCPDAASAERIAADLTAYFGRLRP